MLSLSCVLACTSNSKKESANDWNKGSITIAVDENLQSIIQQMKDVYEAQFEGTKIVLNLQPQDKIINDFINGEITSMIVSRSLTAEEKETAKQNQTVEIIETVFAYDAIAVIAAQDFKDSIFSLTHFSTYLQPESAYKIVFDNQRSGIAKFILNKTKTDAEVFKRALVVNNVEEVVEYVQRYNNAIGFIPFNYISDEDEQQAKKIRSGIKVLHVEDDSVVCSISQENIAAFKYPLQESITIVLGNNPELVGRGFANFLSRDKAAKILLKAGLVPRFMPVRKINITDELKTN